MRRRSCRLSSPMSPVRRLPLYVCGRRMLEAYPYVPIAGHVRISIAIWSYCGRLYLGITGDWQGAPDIGRLARGVDLAFEELLKEVAADAGMSDAGEGSLPRRTIAAPCTEPRGDRLRLERRLRAYDVTLPRVHRKHSGNPEGSDCVGLRVHGRLRRSVTRQWATSCRDWSAKSPDERCLTSQRAFCRVRCPPAGREDFRPGLDRRQPLPVEPGSSVPLHGQK